MIADSTTMIFCQYLKQHEDAMPQAPLPGALGGYLLSHISQKAWQIWLDNQVKIINENRLSLARPADRAYLKQQMRLFFQIPEDLI